MFRSSRCRPTAATPGWRAPATLVFVALLAAPARAQDMLPLKAAIVVNLLQFVQWPGDGERAGGPLTLCADRAGALWPHLTEVRGRVANGARPLELRDLPAAADGLRTCSAWIAEATPSGRRLQASAGAGLPVLVIGDLERADEPGVTIALRLAGSRLGFDVDLGAARRGGLQVSSKLLRLAGKVHE